MRIFSRQFLGACHSWADVGRNIHRCFIKQGHEVHLFSTDGIDHLSKDLKPNLRAYTELNSNQIIQLAPFYEKYDLAISYTAMKNFQPYLAPGKIKFGIYNYDASVLPEHWAKYHNYCDKLLPSSKYAEKTFLDAKIPENKIEVVPHGIDIEDFNVEPYKLKTNKSIKILNVCGQLHRRKNIAGILEAYGKAFSKKDDVCLVLKVADKKPTAKFEVSFKDLYSKWKKKNPNAGEVEIISEYIENIESLFVACDIHFSLSNIECFHIPSLESMAAGCLTIQSGYGGHTDFMNDNNSLLVDGKLGRCPPRYQYWTPSPYAQMFLPDKNDAVDKLRYAVNNYEKLMKQFKPNIEKTVNTFTWANVAKQILELTND